MEATVLTDWIDVTEPGTKIILSEPITQPEFLIIYTGNGQETWFMDYQIFLNNPNKDRAILTGPTASGKYKLIVNSDTELEVVYTDNMIRRVYKAYYQISTNIN